MSRSSQDSDDDVFGPTIRTRRRDTTGPGDDVEMVDDGGALPQQQQSGSSLRNMDPTSTRAFGSALRDSASSRYPGLGRGGTLPEATRSLTYPDPTLLSPSGRLDLKRPSPGKPSSSEKRHRSSKSPTKSPPKEIESSKFSEPLLGSWVGHGASEEEEGDPAEATERLISEVEAEVEKEKEEIEAMYSQQLLERCDELRDLKLTANLEVELSDCQQQLGDLRTEHETLQGEMEDTETKMQEANERIVELKAELEDSEGKVQVPREEFGELVERGQAAVDARDRASLIGEAAVEALEITQDYLLSRGMQMPREVLELLDKLKHGSEDEDEDEDMEDDEEDGGVQVL